MSPEDRDRLAEHVRQRRVMVCTGTGGVGKTSVAAAVAIHAAREGRRAVVLTIDPARRLADALGLNRLDNTPHRIDGPWPGELHAAMLDPAATFDDLVSRHAHDAAQARRILDNRFYRNIAHALSGTQEYMAAEKLHELHDSGRFDLIVLDTPPTRQALDFLDAPERLVRFLDNRVYRMVTGTGGGVGRAVALAGTAVLRSAGRLVGTEVIDEAVTFFRSFDGMHDGFRRRAVGAGELLRSADTTFVVVATPQAGTLAEAGFLVAGLAQRQVALGAVVLNRVTPRFTTLDPAHLESLAATAATATAAAAGGHPLPPAGELANLAELTRTVDAEEATIDRFLDLATGAPTVRVAQLDEDVHDLDGLESLRRALFDPL